MNQTEPIGILLAAGNGKRFSPFITPKPFFPFLGQTLIDYALDDFIRLGLHEIILVINDHAAEFEIKPRTELTMHFIHQAEAIGMADAVLKCQGLIEHRPVVIRNGTNCFNASLIENLKNHLYDGIPYISVAEVDSYFPGAYVTVENDCAKNIIEKPGLGQEPSHFVNIVFHFFPNSDLFLNFLKVASSDHDDTYEVALNQLMSSQKVGILNYQESWQSLKYPWHILSMMKYFLNERLSVENHAVDIADTARLYGKIYVGNGVKILDGAVIQGPAYIGDNSFIGNHALIVESMIGENNQIGFCTEVTRSYLGNGNKLHHAYVGDSVLEKEVRFGSGTTTANLRLDQKSVGIKIGDGMIDSCQRKLGALIGAGASMGIQCGLMPGVRIGTQAVVGPGEMVFSDIGPQQHLFHPVSKSTEQSL